jgi:hypothetical protein
MSTVAAACRHGSTRRDRRCAGPRGGNGLRLCACRIRESETCFDWRRGCYRGSEHARVDSDWRFGRCASARNNCRFECCAGWIGVGNRSVDGRRSSDSDSRLIGSALIEGCRSASNLLVTLELGGIDAGTSVCDVDGAVGFAHKAVPLVRCSSWSRQSCRVQ